LPFGQLDVFLNVVGGVQIDEPAGDLAVVAALVSAVLNRGLPPTAVFVGEVGLGGELRAVSQIERRLTEAARMGFTHAYVPQKSAPRGSSNGLQIIGVPDVRALPGTLQP
jgi:DNA repair protein RadA/Sms